MGRVVR